MNQQLSVLLEGSFHFFHFRIGRLELRAELPELHDSRYFFESKLLIFAHSLDGFENRIVLEFLERVSIAAGINQALANTQPVGPPGAR